MTNEMTKAFRILGYKVMSPIYGFEGVVTSISFDLNGCVQAAVRPQGLSKEGKFQESFGWFDTKALVIVSNEPLQEQPDFCVVPGGIDLAKPGK